MNFDLLWLILGCWFASGPIGVYLYYRLYNIPRFACVYFILFKSFLFFVLICFLGPLCLCVWDVNRRDRLSMLNLKPKSNK